MTLTKETLSKMSIEQLEGKLAEAKSNFNQLSQTLSKERQKQILKSKAIRGKAAKRKAELISQILKIQRATGKVQAQINAIKFGAQKAFNVEVNAAIGKVKKRQEELKTFGSYRTSITDHEKILYWCECMHFDQEDLDKVLELYTEEQLAEMSGDEFYDEVRAARIGVDTKPRDITEEARKMTSFNIPQDDTIMF